jgi:hypothetical protein
VKPSRLLLLLCTFLLAGCYDYSPYPAVGKGTQKYTLFTVTDARGELIATWISEGRVRGAEGMYFIKAVERRIPEGMVFKYPNGRAATVAGQNIIMEEIPKPDWLAALDQQAGHETERVPIVHVSRETPRMFR